MLLAQRGIAMGARRGGKLKSAIYMVAGSASLILASARRLELFDSFRPPLAVFTNALYVLAALLALASFADYFVQYRKLSARS